MAAGLGFILGAGIGAVAGHAREKRWETLRQQEQFNQFMEQHLQQHPEDADNPEFAKHGKKIFGEYWEPMQGMLHLAAQSKQKEEQQFQQLIPGGGGPTGQAASAAGPAAGTSPTAPPGGPNLRNPQTLEDWTALHQKLILGRAHFTDAGHLKALDAEIKVAEQQIEKLTGERIELSKEARAPGLKAAETTASTTARIGAETTPGAIAAESKLAGAKSGAEAASREAVELSPEVTKGKAEQAAAIESVKEQVKQKVGKPWTPKDALDARTKAETQAKNELTSAGWFGSVRQATGAKVKARAAEILASEGLHPDTGQRLKEGEKIVINGKPFTWHEPK